MSIELNRREFLGKSMAGGVALAAGLTAAAQEQVTADPVVLGVVGMNRGKALALDFVKAPGCRIKYVCDLDRNRLAEGQAAIGEGGEQRAQRERPHL